MKKCIRCGEVKPFEDYFKCSRIKDGYMGYCRVCHNKNNKGVKQVLYSEVVAGNTYKNTLGEEFTVASISGKTAYIYFNELLHGSISIDKVRVGKVFANSNTGNIRNKVSKGQVIGNLTILEDMQGRNSKVKISCKCGNISSVRIGYLISGGNSCGCILKEDSLTVSNFKESMSKWNPTTHRTDVKKLPIFKLNPEGEGCHIDGWTYVDEFIYNRLSKCMVIRSGYVLLGLNKLNSDALGIKYNYDNKDIPLHSWVKAMPTGVKDLVTDHKNGCKLDNRMCNLRIANYKENAGNSKSKGKSGYRGVKYLDDKPRNKPWYARQGEFIDGRQVDYSLGYFANKDDAAKAVDIFNIERYGEFVRLNLKRSIYEDMGLLPKTEKRYKLP